ncbi:hypothetical protein B0H19DRAFT_1069733 [Mycena capillaripes]|nr:hypothetical protein B0H19DRAFT_1069733 [Mycena capillaripes]
MTSGIQVIHHTHRCVTLSPTETASSVAGLLHSGVAGAVLRSIARLNTCAATGQTPSNMIATPPPAEPEHISVSAILFPTDGDRPRIITVKCRPPHDSSRDLFPVPLLQPYFDARPESVILTRGPNGELLAFPLHGFYSPIALTKGSPINHSIYRITGGPHPSPGVAPSWRSNTAARVAWVILRRV